MMTEKSYSKAVDYIAQISPSLKKPGEFITWAETMCDVLSFIYNEDYDKVTQDIYEAAKEEQGYEDSEC